MKFPRPLPLAGLIAAACALLLPMAAPAAYEAEMAAFAAQDAANPPPDDVIVFTGSSSITGWSGLAAAFPGYPVLNRGFGGSQMNDVLDKFDNVITPYQAPLIVLYEGDNDIWGGETPAAVFAEYVTFVNRVDAELPGTDIIIIAVKPSPSRVTRMAAMAELNGMIRDLCAARPNLRYADVFTPMLDGSGQPRPELFGSDMLHMNAAGYTIWKNVLAPLLAEAPFSSGNSFRLDFGSTALASGTGWNNVTAEIGSDPAGVLTGLSTPDGTVTAAGLAIEIPFNGANDQGTTLSSIFPAAATQDSLFGNTGIFDGKANVFPRFRLTGLDPELVYRLTFYASRNDVTDNRETVYTVTGAATTTAILNASSNINGIAMVRNVAPDSESGITVSLAPGTGNNSPSLFTYLGALKVDGLAAPPADTQPPLLLSAAGRSGVVIELTFNEDLDPASIGNPSFYTVNGGTSTVSSASLLTGGRVVSLTLTQSVSGSVTVAVTGVTDAAGNPVAAGAQAEFNMPSFQPGAMLFDFGGNGSATEAGDDPVRRWNNITAAIGTSDTGSLTTLVTTANQPTAAAFRMIKRFNSANTDGTLVSTVYTPDDASRDTLFGNKEVFGGLANISPSFKLTGLVPSQPYDLTFYASRMNASDNRQTRYEVIGTNTLSVLLQVADNINGVALAKGVYPGPTGEIIVNLFAGPANNNSYHFTYLGVMEVSPAPPLSMMPAQVTDGRIHLQWTGTGQLEHADTPAGPWTAIQPAPEPPYSELLTPSGRRFYRLRPSQP